jgi:hypothetical protein
MFSLSLVKQSSDFPFAGDSCLKNGTIRYRGFYENMWKYVFTSIIVAELIFFGYRIPNAIYLNSNPFIQEKNWKCS